MRREEILVKAAGKLQGLADDIHRSETVGGQWLMATPEDVRAKADHDECVELAAGLLAMARRP